MLTKEQELRSALKRLVMHSAFIEAEGPLLKVSHCGVGPFRQAFEALGWQEPHIVDTRPYHRRIQEAEERRKESQDG